jgi:hypothetical protein
MQVFQGTLSLSATINLSIIYLHLSPRPQRRRQRRVAQKSSRCHLCPHARAPPPSSASSSYSCPRGREGGLRTEAMVFRVLRLFLSFLSSGRSVGRTMSRDANNCLHYANAFSTQAITGFMFGALSA